MKTRGILGYLGVIPFIYALVFFNENILGSNVTGQYLFVVYSIGILSFVSGTLWQPNKDEANTPFISNVFCLFAVFAIFLPLNLGLLWLASCYVLLWYSELKLTQSQRITHSREYMVMRRRLTMLVVTFHIIALLNLHAE